MPPGLRSFPVTIWILDGVRMPPKIALHLKKTILYAVLKIHLFSLVLFEVMKLLKQRMNIRAVRKLLYSDLSCFCFTVQILHIFNTIIPSTREGSGCRIKIYVGVCAGEKNN